MLTLVENPLAFASFAAGAICYVGWPFCRNHRLMLLLQTGVGSGFALHYALMGAPTASAVNALSALQIIAAMVFGPFSRSRWIAYLLLPGTVAACIFTWDGWHSLLAAVATLLISFGRLQANPDRMRILVAAGTPFWLAHDLIIMSPIAILDAFSFATGIYGIWRQGLLRRPRVGAGRLGSTPYRGSLET